MYTEITNSYQIYCTYGHLEANDDIAYIVELDDGGKWYVIDGSENACLTYDEIVDGQHMEDLTVVDCFTGITFYSLSQFVDAIVENIAPETTTQVNLSIEFESSNAAFNDDNAQAETVRILKELINKVENNEYLNESIKDVNGNSIGNIYFDIEEIEV